MKSLLPGLGLCVAVSLTATGLASVEGWVFGRAWLEPLVLAILLGAVIRTVLEPGARWADGIRFSAKTVLEVAVVLLGASVSLSAILAAGPALFIGIAVVVVLAILASYGIGRALGLRHRLAVLVACGNSICGNSAIAAVAPVIGAGGDDIAAAIAFTAVLGVPVVLFLPLAAPLLHLSGSQYGVLAGLTVYAVPQVLAATAPLGLVAVQLGTMVKLARVLMLGPVVLTLSLLGRRERGGEAGGRIALSKLVPWFILGFIALAGLREAGLVPGFLLDPVATLAGWLTVISMAALGLCTDFRVVARAGGRVTGVIVLSLSLLGAISLGLIRLLGMM